MTQPRSILEAVMTHDPTCATTKPSVHSNPASRPGCDCSREARVREALETALPVMAAARLMGALDDLCANNCAESREMDVTYELRERASKVVDAIRAHDAGDDLQREACEDCSGSLREALETASKAIGAYLSDLEEQRPDNPASPTRLYHAMEEARKALRLPQS